MVLKNATPVIYRYDITFKAFQPKGFPEPEKDLTVPEGKKLMQVIRCALETPTFQDIRSNIATDFAKTLISCKKLDDRQMKTGKFKFWAENEIDDGGSKPQKNANRFQMTLKDNGELRIFDLLSYLTSPNKTGGAYEQIVPIVQALDIILGHHGKLSLSIATPKRGKCFPYAPTGAEKFQLEGPKGHSGYLQGVRGFFASIPTTSQRALVNCNACCGAFYKPGPLDSLFEMFIPREGAAFPEQSKRLEKAI